MLSCSISIEGCCAFASVGRGTLRCAKLICSLKLLPQFGRSQILANVGQPQLQSMQGVLDMLCVAEGYITPHGVWT